MKKILKLTMLSAITLIFAGSLACSLLAQNQETVSTATAAHNYVDCSDFIDVDCRRGWVVNDTSASIIGKWQLIKILSASRAARCQDYCQSRIVYEFKPNGIVTISRSSDADANLRVEEEHLYSFVEERFGYKLLKIDSSTYWCGISSKRLRFDMSHLNGPKLYFVRIN